MATNREEFEYDLDASGLLDEFAKIESMIRRVNDVSKAQAKIIGQVNSVFDMTVSQIKELIKQEEALALAGKETEAGFKGRYVASMQLVTQLEREKQVEMALTAARTNAVIKQMNDYDALMAKHREYQAALGIKQGALRAEVTNSRVEELIKIKRLTVEQIALEEKLQASQRAELTAASSNAHNAKVEEFNRLMNEHLAYQAKLKSNAVASQKALNDQLNITKTNAEAIFQIDQRQARLASAAGRSITNAGQGPTGAMGNNALGRAMELIEAGKISARRVVQIYDEVNSGIKKSYMGVERTVAQTANTVVRENKRMATKTEESSKAIGLSWASLGKLLLVQNIHLAVYRFIAALEASFTAATQFEIKISEIRTISQDSQISFDKWSTTVRRLSDEFGAPILDVAAGLYETISNQIAKGAEAATFMAKAMQFARTTVASTDEAVNLLSSALNSYNLKVQDTDRVSAILFKTIDLGRVRASEMANTFGRVAGLAAPLGVSLEEVSASIATLTINGVKYNEAYTLINNIMLKLLRPTKDMKELMKEWGFSSGQAAISGLGFVGVLKRLETETRTSADEIGELFNQIRGIRGVLGLTGSAFQTFERDLAQISNASAEYQAAQVIAAESAGKRFEIEMNKVKNMFISDIGEPLIKALIAWTDKSDEAGNHIRGLSDTIRDAFKYVKIAAEAFILYKTAMVLTGLSAVNLKKEHVSLTAVQYATGLAQRVLTRDMKIGEAAALAYSRSLRVIKANLGSLGITAAAIGISYIYTELQQQADDLARFQEEADTRIATSLEKLSSVFNTEVDKQTEAIKRGFTEKYRATLDYSSKVRATLSKMADAEKKVMESLVTLTKDSFALAEKAAASSLRKIEQLTEKARSNAERAREAATGEGFDKSRFEGTIDGLPPDAQIVARIAKIRELQAAAAGKLAGAKNKAPDEAARDQAEATKLIAQAEAQITKLYEQRADASEKIRQLTDKSLEATAREAYARENAQIAEQIRLLDSRKSKTSEDIKNLREIRARQADIEKQRRSNVRDAADQAELKMQETVLKNIGTEADLAKIVADYEKQKRDAFLEYAAAQDKLAESLQKQAEAQAKQFELLKNAASDAAKFKLNAEGNNEAEIRASVAAQLKAFDEIMKQAAGNGADSQTQNQLVRQRAELEKQASIEVERRRLDDMTERLAQEKDLALKNIEEVANRKKDLEDAQNKVRLSIEERIKEAFAASKVGLTANLGALIHSQNYQEKRRAEETIKGAFTLLEESLKNSALSPKEKNNQITTRGNLILQQLGILDALSNNGTIKEKDAMGKGGKTFNDLTDDIAQLLRKMQDDLNRQRDFSETEKKLADQLKALGIREAQMKNGPGSQPSLEDKYNATIRNTTTNLQQFESAIISAGQRLRNLGGPQGVSYVPNNLSPSVNTAVSGGAGSRTTSYGNINVTVQGNGNPNYDGAALASAIARAQRLGQLTPQEIA